jgi:hypothetical protein
VDDAGDDPAILDETGEALKAKIGGGDHTGI